jgi:putative FmdB family regulatory protein
VPVYEYKCATCDAAFEQRRSMADADAPVTCPQGHAEVKRLLSVFAAGGRAESGGSAMPAPSGGGYGGHCACH